MERGDFMFKEIRNWAAGFSDPFAEAVKEAFRTMLWSVAGQLLLYFTGKATIEVVYANLVIVFLSALDRYKYAKGKQTGYVAGERPTGLSPI